MVAEEKHTQRKMGVRGDIKTATFLLLNVTVGTGILREYFTLTKTN